MTRLPHAKKSYGQNFLVDQGVLKKIVNAGEIEAGETILEIGPGTGILTEALLNAGAKVIAVEADPELAEVMRKKFGARIELIEGDILSREVSEKLRLLGVGKPATEAYVDRRTTETEGPHNNADEGISETSCKLVANIPYNITSSVLEKFLSQPPRPSRLVLMVQREVADRLTARPGEMSVLAVMCQLYAECRKVANVPAGAFRPAPKVDSAIVRLDVRPLPLLAPHWKGEGSHARPPLKGGQSREPGSRFAGQGVDPEAVIQLAKAGFSSRRKQLHGNLARAGRESSENIKQILTDLGLPADVRAEVLTVNNWIRLFQSLRGLFS